MSERCAICGCDLHRDGEYAKPTIKGRSHATRHHFVAERFFGRSANRRGTQRSPIFKKCPWGVEKQSAVFCYECHEELIHYAIKSDYLIPLLKTVDGIKIQPSQTKPVNLLSLVEELKKSVVMIKVY